jgi:hypothetical protein
MPKNSFQAQIYIFCIVYCCFSKAEICFSQPPWTAEELDLVGGTFITGCGGDENEPLPIQELTDFVKNESLRYKMALLPAYKAIDSLLQDSVWRKNFEQNPLLPLAPWLAGYVYAPVFQVNQMKCNQLSFPRGCYRNIYVVTKTERFIRNPDADSTLPLPPPDLFPSYQIPEKYGYVAWKKSTYPDTLFYELSGEYLPFRDIWFTVLYCKKAGLKFMTGGNAFLKKMPYYWFAGGTGAYRGETYGLNWASIRTVFTYTDELDYSNQNYTTSPPDTFTYQGFHLRDPLAIIKISSNHKNDTVEYLMYTRDFDYNILRLLKQYNITKYKNLKGFPAYEIKYRLYLHPEHYEDILPMIRGINQEELQTLIKEGYGKFIR